MWQQCFIADLKGKTSEANESNDDANEWLQSSTLFLFRFPFFANQFKVREVEYDL